LYSFEEAVKEVVFMTSKARHVRGRGEKGAIHAGEDVFEWYAVAVW
jgi:hypothetical protein